MKTRAAYFISFLFHPVVLALTAPFVIIYQKYANTAYAFKWMTFSALFLFVTLFAVFLMWRHEFFTDFDIARRRKRVVFYAIVGLVASVYLAIATSFKSIFFPLSIVAFGVVIGAVLLEIVNLYLKASMHMAVVCAFVLTMSDLFGLGGFLVSFWIVPWVLWSRLYLQKHTPREIVVGGLYGMSITILTVVISRFMQA